MRYEYLALPAPQQTKPSKVKKPAVERLAAAVTDMINEMADDGWEYMRTETLTVEDKPSRFSKAVERIETVMIFRREWGVEELVHNDQRNALAQPLETAPPAAEIIDEQPAVMDQRPVAPGASEAPSEPYHYDEAMEEPLEHHRAEDASDDEKHAPILGGMRRD